MIYMHMNIRKEMFSIAYIGAVAARLGLEVIKPNYDFDSVDGMLVSSGGTAPQINFQAKARVRSKVLRGDHIALPLSIKNYNDLRGKKAVPRILIVMLLPDEDSDWLTVTDEGMCLRHCAYWVSLRGEPKVPNATDNKTVYVPTANIFDQYQLSSMFSRVGQGGVP